MWGPVGIGPRQHYANVNVHFKRNEMCSLCQLSINVKRRCTFPFPVTNDPGKKKIIWENCPTRETLANVKPLMLAMLASH